MANPNDNGFTLDLIETRLYRLLRMQNNIDTHKVALGVAGPLLLWAEGCYDRFSGAVTAGDVEAGEAKDATLMLHDKFAATLDYYQNAKEILMATLAAYKPDKILLASYCVEKKTPQTYQYLKEAIDAFKETHDRLVLAADPRVIAQAIVDAMVLLGDDFKAAIETAGLEKRQSDSAFREQHTFFEEDSLKLKLIFKIACMVWGNDDPKLKDLGFVPASEIWTPGGGVNPEIGIPEDLAFEIIGADVRVFWHAVVGADNYQLSHTQHPPLFLQLFEGAETEFLHLGPDAGTHYYKVRAKVGEEYGAWSEQIEVEVTVAAPAPPINLILTVGMANDIKATWDSAPGVVYDGCSIYYADVATGDPEPAMPTAPYFVELIVYTFTLPVLASGKTRYVWVTGTKDGAESDPCGPEFVSIP
jgi:hypothetical protein